MQSLVGAPPRADVDDCVAVAERAVADGVADPKRLCAVAGATEGSSPQDPWASDRTCSMRGASQPGDGHRGDGALTDIPDWCFVETLGREAYSDLPSTEALIAMRERHPCAVRQRSGQARIGRF